MTASPALSLTSSVQHLKEEVSRIVCGMTSSSPFLELDQSTAPTNDVQLIHPIWGKVIMRVCDGDTIRRTYGAPLIVEVLPPDNGNELKASRLYLFHEDGGATLSRGDKISFPTWRLAINHIKAHLKDLFRGASVWERTSTNDLEERPPIT